MYLRHYAAQRGHEIEALVVAVANLLVISDDVWREWETSSATDRLRQATRRAEQVVLRAVAQL